MPDMPAPTLAQTPAPTIVILDVSMSDDGHRGNYMAFLNRLYTTRRVPFHWGAARIRQPVLVPMIEESFWKYAAICVLRSVLGHRTVGFLFRPRPALEGQDWRLRVKRWVLRGLRRLSETRTLTILPFSVEPGFAKIADDWIYDFETWDLIDDGPTPAPPLGPLGEEILGTANGRMVCCSIGRQDPSKGFDRFADMYHASAPLRAAMLFACGGKITPAMASRKASLEEHGGFIRDRFITEAELRDFYASADVIWCVYAPDYDQASGILGRAMQLGLPVVVRKGSLIHRLCADEGVAHVALDDATDVADIIALASRKDPAKGAARALSHRAQSLRRLNDALGVGASSNFACAPGTPQ